MGDLFLSKHCQKKPERLSWWTALSCQTICPIRPFHLISSLLCQIIRPIQPGYERLSLVYIPGTAHGPAWQSQHLLRRLFAPIYYPDADRSVQNHWRRSFRCTIYQVYLTTSEGNDPKLTQKKEFLNRLAGPKLEWSCQIITNSDLVIPNSVNPVPGSKQFSEKYLGKSMTYRLLPLL